MLFYINCLAAQTSPPPPCILPGRRLAGCFSLCRQQEQMLDTHAGASCMVSSSPRRPCCCLMQGVAESWTTMLVPPAGCNTVQGARTCARCREQSSAGRPCWCHRQGVLMVSHVLTASAGSRAFSVVPSVISALSCKAGWPASACCIHPV